MSKFEIDFCLFLIFDLIFDVNSDDSDRCHYRQLFLLSRWREKEKGNLKERGRRKTAIGELEKEGRGDSFPNSDDHCEYGLLRRLGITPIFI